MIFLLRYILGFIKLSVSGSEAEKFLNITAVNRIKLWDLKYRKNSIEGYISIYNFKRLRNIVRGFAFKIYILEKRGLPFKILKYKNRYGIIIGFCLFFCVLYFLNNYIWILDIKGNEKIENNIILELCQNQGIFIGVKKRNIDTIKGAQKLLLNNSNLTWAALNIEGCVLTIDVKEANFNTDKSREPSNLKAEYDGVISKIDIISGTPLVKPGDVVLKGDILISGINEGNNKTEYVKSKGEVIAHTEVIYKEFAPFKEKIKEKNGKKFSRYTLSFFGVNFPLYFEKNHKDFISDKKVYKLKILNKYMPICITQEKIYYTKTINKKYSEEKLIKALNDIIIEKINSEEYINYSEKNYNEIIDKKGITVEKTIVFEKNIAKEQILLINTTN